MKLAPIACDLALAAVCFAFAKKRLGEGTALAVAAMLALNPAFIVTGAAGGRSTPCWRLLLVLMLLEAPAGQWRYRHPDLSRLRCWRSRRQVCSCRWAWPR